MPVVLVNPDGDYEFHNGSLISLDPELSGKPKIQKYAQIRKRGWHDTDFGSRAYCIPLPDGTVYVFVGIVTTDRKTNRRLGTRAIFSSAAFEGFANSLITREEDFKLKAENDLNLLVHDLRRLSNSIYQSAMEARNLCERNNPSQAIVRIDNVIASQSMLTIRTDVLDFSGNPNLEQTKEKVPVYRKIDKVVRSFRPTAERKNISITLNGNSHSRSLGPDAFEIVPYIIVDNAIKYSPNHSTVEVNIYEALGEINAVFSSIGPPMTKKEQNRIFRKGYRSEGAKKLDPSGSGVGLFLAKNLIEQFDGKIWVEVGDEDIPTSKGVCRKIEFRVSVPIAEDT